MSDLSGTYHILEAQDDSGEAWIPFMDGSLTVGGTSDAGNHKAVKLSIVHGQEDDEYRFSIPICNSLSVTKRLRKITDSPRYNLSKDDFVMSTRMLSSPPYDEAERKLSTLMSSGWHSVEPSTSDPTLTFFNADQQPIMTCRRA